MAIDKREANALVESMTSLLDSLDQNFDSLPSGLDTVVKEAKLTLLYCLWASKGVIFTSVALSFLNMPGINNQV